MVTCKGNWKVLLRPQPFAHNRTGKDRNNNWGSIRSRLPSVQTCTTHATAFAGAVCFLSVRMMSATRLYRTGYLILIVSRVGNCLITDDDPRARQHRVTVPARPRYHRWWDNFRPETQVACSIDTCRHHSIWHAAYIRQCHVCMLRNMCGRYSIGQLRFLTSSNWKMAYSHRWSLVSCKWVSRIYWKRFERFRLCDANSGPCTNVQAL